jgi:hypothetical protein
VITESGIVLQDYGMKQFDRRKRSREVVRGEKWMDGGEQKMAPHVTLITNRPHF